MIEQSELYSRFQFYRFSGYAKTVRDILSTYEIVDVTINNRGKDALVTSHNVNGGGMINQSGNAKRNGQRWPNLSLGCNEPNKL